MDVHLQRRGVADHQDRVADLLEHADEVGGLQVRARDREVRAVVVLARLVLGQVEVADRRCLVGELGRVLSAQGGDQPGDDHGQPVGPGVDHARLAQDLELLGAALDGFLARLQRSFQHVGEQHVLLLRARVARQPLALHVGQVLRHAVGHRPDRGEHRPLGRVAHGLVGRVGRAGKSGGHQDRVDQLARPRGQLLGRAADDLGEDHARVPAGAEQRRAGDHRDQLVAPDLVDHLAVDGVELVQHGAHGHRHVVAGVAVGDREDVEVVDLLTAALELRISRRHRPFEADQTGIWHRDIHTRAAARRVTPAPVRLALVRTVYLGTSDFAVQVLRRLADSPHRPAARGHPARPPEGARAQAAVAPGGRRRPPDRPARHPAGQRQLRRGARADRSREARRGGDLRVRRADQGAAAVGAPDAERPPVAACRAGAGPRRSSGRSTPGTRRPASASCARSRRWTPGRCACARRSRSGPTTTSRRCRGAWPTWAASCSSRRSTSGPTAPSSRPRASPRRRRSPPRTAGSTPPGARSTWCGACGR